MTIKCCGCFEGNAEPRCEVVGTVTDGRTLLEMAAKLQPEVIVLDITMPQLNGLDPARHLERTTPKLSTGSSVSNRLISSPDC
jgi:DNA-binding NarL/FixJ family response regulator